MWPTQRLSQNTITCAYLSLRFLERETDRLRDRDFENERERDLDADLEREDRDPDLDLFVFDISEERVSHFSIIPNVRK